jgi:hypothetical protein
MRGNTLAVAPPGMLNHLNFEQMLHIDADEAVENLQFGSLDLGMRVKAGAVFTYVASPSRVRANVGEMMLMQGFTSYAVKALARASSRYNPEVASIGADLNLTPTIRKLSAGWAGHADWQRFAMVLYEGTLFRNRLSHCSFAYCLHEGDEWVFLLEDGGQVGIKMLSRTFSRLIEVERLVAGVVVFLSTAPEWRADDRFETLDSSFLRDALTYSLNSVLEPKPGGRPDMSAITDSRRDWLARYFLDPTLGLIPPDAKTNKKD